MKYQVADKNAVSPYARYDPMTRLKTKACPTCRPENAGAFPGELKACWLCGEVWK